VEELVLEADELVLQNGKFDVKAIGTVHGRLAREWPWEKTHDTLCAGHLLASNQQHDLTSMVLHYLGEDIKPAEDLVEVAVLQCRRRVQAARLKVKRSGQGPKIAQWRIAEAGLEDMPSAKEKTWKFDLWLPKALFAVTPEKEREPEWATAAIDYANADSLHTLLLWMKQRQELEARGLWDIYEARRPIVGVVHGMESMYGVTGSRKRKDKIYVEFKNGSAQAAARCVSIAKSYGFDLTLPKSGNNGSLTAFCFGKEHEPRKFIERSNGVVEFVPPEKTDYLNLPVLEWTEGGKPSLNQDVMDKYELILEGRQLEFILALKGKRKRDTACGFMDGYERFWVAMDEWFRLFPNLNPFGSNTLRFTSQQPNSQNISAESGFNVRYMFGPLPGREWWPMDYENLELRIPGYESGEKSMIELFEKPNDPPFFGSYHLLNASLIYPDLFWPLAEQRGAFKKKYEDTWYGWLKNFDFATQYQAGEETADRAAHKPGAWRAAKAGLKRMTALNDHYVFLANKFGFVETIPDKTVDPKRGYPIMVQRGPWGKVKPTLPLNYHVQSTAMWCTMKAMIRCEEQLKEWRADGFMAYMILQVHDEIVFDFPAGGRANLPRVKKLQRLMEESGQDIGIPLSVAYKWCPENWATAEKMPERAYARSGKR
jgi:DNA polymerase I-like protein with 3'-5' exonuclease and polymerase domains